MATVVHRVLVVDDDRDSAEAFQALLESWGYAVAVGHDAAAGLAAASARLPDAVILDFGLPTFDDGDALLRSLRKLPGGDEVLVLAVTGHGAAIDRRRAIAAGCDFFFVKPADLDQIREALSTIDAHREWAIHARRS
jgi:DNA-binding response OmpR family regulator